MPRLLRNLLGEWYCLTIMTKKFQDLYHHKVTLVWHVGSLFCPFLVLIFDWYCYVAQYRGLAYKEKWGCAAFHPYKKPYKYTLFQMYFFLIFCRKLKKFNPTSLFSLSLRRLVVGMKCKAFRTLLWSTPMPRSLRNLLAEWYCLTIMTTKFENLYYHEVSLVWSVARIFVPLRAVVFYWELQMIQYRGFEYDEKFGCAAFSPYSPDLARRLRAIVDEVDD